MKLNDILHGFKINRINHLEEISGDLYEMGHLKTSAKLLWLKRDDENKSFGIAFKTTPTDDTGVFHILEHCVLNGSKRYPVREPFVDLLKGSLQTFLNAMTYSDKTVYPVSSRNNKDFINLMRVYLDAVFNPLVLENPNIFYQEGWHYELNDINETPIYKGVVFNEMKGAFSSADSVKSRMIMHSLFPDNCYGNESGGDPEFITDLTYEQFCAAHKKYYNPSNSYIFLDGDMDIDNILAIIDDEYLNNYGKEGDLIDFVKQEPIINEELIEYEISSEADPKGKAHISYGQVIGNYDETEKIMAFSLISSILCGSNESPIKKLIIDNGLGEDVYVGVQDGIYQPYFVIDIVNTDLEKEELIKEKISEELNRLVKDGLNKEELEANLNQREFKAKERDFGGAPKGLVYGLSALDTWLYGGDPIDSICYGDLFDKLREKINTSYYEDLIKEYIIDSKHHAKILLKPSNTLGEAKLEKEKNKLINISSTWSEEYKKELVELNKNLKMFQESEDTPEQKASLPRLHLDDLKKEVTKYEYEVTKHNDNTIIKHHLDTNGISYINTYIEIDDLKLEEYRTLSFMIKLLASIKTKNYDLLTLNRKMRSILGDFGLDILPVTDIKTFDQKTYVSLRWSSLLRNDNEAIDLVQEIIHNTDFSDKQAIRNIIKQAIIGLEQSFINSGHALALLRMLAQSSSRAAISEQTSGLSFYYYLKNIDNNWDELNDNLINELQALKNKLFIKERYIVSVASDDSDNIINSFIDNEISGTIGEYIDKKPLGKRNEGIIVPSNVSYAVKGSASLENNNIGALHVLSNILTYDYLWNNVRVKNGAYGCGFKASINKSAYFYSYRDPSPNLSLDIYSNTTKYLKDLVDRNEDLENYIVGTTGDFDPLLTNKTQIRRADADYLANLNDDDKQKVLTEILNTSIDDIKEAIKIFEKINEENNICVVGNKDSINQCKDKLDIIYDFNQKQ